MDEAVKKGWAQIGGDAIIKEEDIQVLFNLIDKYQSGALSMKVTNCTFSKYFVVHDIDLYYEYFP